GGRMGPRYRAGGGVSSKPRPQRQAEPLAAAKRRAAAREFAGAAGGEGSIIRHAAPTGPIRRPTPPTPALSSFLVRSLSHPGASAGARSRLGDQPRVIRVPIRSAGQTRLTGALINASLDGLLPSGRPTM